jgi:hypothetical protein
LKSQLHIKTNLVRSSRGETIDFAGAHLYSHSTIYRRIDEKGKHHSATKLVYCLQSSGGRPLWNNFPHLSGILSRMEHVGDHHILSDLVHREWKNH